MARLRISMDGAAVRDVELTSTRTTIGRTAGNDIVLNDAVVSGEHAALQLEHGAALTDLGSTNGTYVNGRRIDKHLLQHGDEITIGNHTLRFIDEAVQDFAATVVLQQEPASALAGQAMLKILNGPRAGELMPISRQRTALGKPGVQVAMILQQGDDYQLLPIALENKAITTRLNSRVVGSEAIALKTGDVITIADVRLEFTRE